MLPIRTMRCRHVTDPACMFGWVALLISIQDWRPISRCIHISASNPSRLPPWKRCPQRSSSLLVDELISSSHHDLCTHRHGHSYLVMRNCNAEKLRKPPRFAGVFANVDVQQMHLQRCERACRLPCTSERYKTTGRPDRSQRGPQLPAMQLPSRSYLNVSVTALHCIALPGMVNEEIT
jgi:hypothetical protein